MRGSGVINVGIVGATGYTGVELLRLAVQHPGMKIRAVTSRAEDGVPVVDLFPNLRGYLDIAFSAPDAGALRDCDLVFFATPNGTAMTMVPELLDAGVRIIDLSADFRIRDARVWSRWYGMEHACPELLERAVYGLPEVNRTRIAGTDLVANPGCYPTAVQLGFLPLVKSGLVSGRQLIADVKSGVSGAGRRAEIPYLLCEAGENMKAYGVGGHRHLPEIEQGLNDVSDEPVRLTFIPHLTPMIRGIHATLYAPLPDTEVDLQNLYEDFYAREPFVDVLGAGSAPDTRSVRGSNFCRIAVHRSRDGEMAVILATEDNLVKGAAGQAIQNMNIMFGLDETLGLRHIAAVP